MKSKIQGIITGAFICLLHIAMGQGTNKPIMQIFKVGADQPALLKWTSQTNEIYQIDFKSNLMTNWTTAADNIGSQGTNTVWADLGTESEFYPRSSSGGLEAPIRFYRVGVQSYATNNFSANITISNAADNTLLSGLTNIFASVTTSSNVIAGSLLVDGNEDSFGPGTNYTFPIETRLHANGVHRLTVSVENDGDTGTTGGDDPVPDPTSDANAHYAAKNAGVIFSNFLSDVHLKYQGYRPELGQTQEVHGVWGSAREWRVDITPANDTNTVYRSFTGSGRKISVRWDGLDSNGQDLSPQRIAYVIYDLGESQSMMAFGCFSECPEEWELWAQPTNGIGDAVPFVVYPPGTDTNTLFFFEVLKPCPQDLIVLSEQNGPMDAGGDTSDPFIVYSSYKIFGSFGMLYQGNHPAFGGYPRPPRGAPFGQVTFATGHNFPWGKLKAPKKVAAYLATAIRTAGYSIPFIYGDDNFAAQALQKSSLGGSNIFNNVNLALYAGHSAAGKENIVALGHPQTYIPVYNSGSDSFTWIGMNDMNLGSSNLKWAAFYSCNLFRDSAYRSDACYSQMKNNEHLAINTDLHIMQAYATEVTVMPDMGKYWVIALIGGTQNANNHTVLGAWRFVCLNTQPKESSSNANVGRSVYWPECSGDYIYGYGSQTDPDPDHIQGELLEDDQMANTL